MAVALTENNIDRFAALLDLHWKHIKIIDPNSTNSLIDKIFAVLNDLICGKMVVGAGGGGFVQVVLRDGVTKDDIKNRLLSHFGTSSIIIFEQTFFS